MNFEETAVIINGETFDRNNWTRQVSLNVSPDTIELTRLFNKVLSGAKSKRATLQVLGDTVVKAKKEGPNKKIEMFIEKDGKVYPFDSLEPEIKRISDFVSAKKELVTFLRKSDPTIIENYLPVEGETLIEEKKRLSKESFEKLFGVEVPDSYKFSPSLGLNYYPKNIDLELPIIPNPENFSVYGVIRMKGNPKVINTLKILDGKIQDWKRYHNIIVIEHNAYESMRGPYGCKLDNYRTKTKE